MAGMSLTRRKFLRSQGAFLTLPFLPSLASAKTLKTRKKPDKKLVIFYIPNGINRRAFFPGEEEASLPNLGAPTGVTVADSGTLTLTLSPLEGGEGKVPFAT